MPIDDVKLKKLQTLDDITKAGESIKSTDANIDASIFIGMDGEDFDKKVQEAMSKDTAESIFFQNINAVGSDDVFEVLDKNGDGKLSEDEVAAFAGLDGDSTGLNNTELKVLLYDLLKKATDLLPIDNENVDDFVNSMLPSGDNYYNMPSSGGYTPASNGVYGNNGATGANGASGTQNKYAGMSLDELKSEKSSAETKVSDLESKVAENKKAVETKQSDLDKAVEDLEKAEKDLDDADKKMTDSINGDGSIDQKIKDQMSGIDDKTAENDKAMTEIDGKITDKEKEISDNDKALSDKRDAISTKDKDISSMESSISDLNSQLSSISEGSSDKEKGDASGKKSEIKAQIQEKQVQLAALKADRDKLEKERDELTKKGETLKSDLDSLKEEKSKLQTSKNDLMGQKSEIGAQALQAGCGPETKVVIEAYDKAKTAVEKAQKTKEKAETELDKAKETLTKSEADLDVAKDELDDINTQITKKEAPSGDVDSLLETARKYLGYNESDGSYKEFTNGRSEAWCADFVSYVTKEAYGDNLPSGFGSASVSGLLQWGQSNNATVDVKDVEAGQIMIQKNNASHTGIVTAVDRDSSGNITAIHTIEGNTSDKVAERTYTPGSSGFNRITCFVDIDG